MIPERRPAGFDRSPDWTKRNQLHFREGTMKKIIAVVFALALVMAGSTAASAQDASKFSLAPGAGISLPLGDFGDLYNLGFNAGLEADYSVAKDFYLFADVRGNFFSLDITGFGLPKTAKVSGGAESIVTIFVGGKYVFPMPGSVKIYALGGAGLCALSTSDLKADYTVTYWWGTEHIQATYTFDSETDMGITFGMGALYNLKPNLNLFVEFRFVDIFTKGSATQFFPVVAGVSVRV
jgi:opacity protein-like surface antigen